ncbi:MAG: xylulokinase [Actinobacteria bacterium]|nr:xylulokinase [Actinomycetota bacterium]
MLVAGVDSSTQSTKVVLCRAEDGTVVDHGSAPHLDGSECSPEVWWNALKEAGGNLLNRATAIAIAAQQHGMVTLDTAGKNVRPALLWNDVRSAPQASDLVQELGGAAHWARQTGSVPTASFTVTKLRWLRENEPSCAEQVASVLLPHDWLTWRLGGRRALTTDRGDASGTGYWSPTEEAWLPTFIRAALGRDVQVPRIACPNDAVGETETGAVLAPGTGDNMAAALGLGLQAGDVVVSIGTSGTAFALSEVPPGDSTGTVAGFADATGRFLPLVCTLNAVRVLTTVTELLGVDSSEFSRFALAGQPGCGGITLLPYFDGERTPNRPDATGVMRGLTSRLATRENIARATVEGLLASLADAIDHLRSVGTVPRRILLIGGGARSEAVRQLAPTVFDVQVTVPQPAEYVALGAARQAAWALSGEPNPPEWDPPNATGYEGIPNPEIRSRYAALKGDTKLWHAN